jgi:type II secretory ATPase GspE/PulE/Tfp pilus assembly ATPase PilB-like protein
MGVPAYLVADALALTQAQRLVRKLCTYCKRAHPLTPEIFNYFVDHGVVNSGEDPKGPIFEAVGCDECGGSGYHGRIALMELCMVSPELSDMIAREASQSDMRAVARKSGFRSLYQEGLVQVLGGNTTFDEIKCVGYTAV